MSKHIFKYEINTGRAIPMPKGAVVLSVQAQMNIPCLWAVVDPSAPPVLRRIVCYTTGQQLPSNPGIFLGTILLDGATFVLHAYDQGEL